MGEHEQQEEKRATVKVACTIPNGLELQLWRPGTDNDAGNRQMVPDSGIVKIAGPHPRWSGATNPGGLGEPVETEVDAEFFAKWLEQNAKNDIVRNGAVYEVKPRDGDDDERT